MYYYVTLPPPVQSRSSTAGRKKKKKKPIATSYCISQLNFVTVKLLNYCRLQWFTAGICGQLNILYFLYKSLPADYETTSGFQLQKAKP